MTNRIHFNGWIVLAGFCFLLYMLSPILTPFFVAALLAYLANPLVTYVDSLHFKGLHINRTLATLAVMFFMLMLLVLFLLVIIPLFQNEITLLVQKFPQYLNTLKTRVEPWLEQHFSVKAELDIAAIQQLLTEHWKAVGNFARQAAIRITQGGWSIVGWFANILLLPIVLFYLLLDWPLMLQKIAEIIPKKQLKKVEQIATEVDDVLAEFFRGQLTVMLLMSVFYCVGLWIAGLEMAIPVGLLSGLLGFVPYLGIGLGFILAILSSLLEHGSIAHLIPILGVFGIGQLIESMWLTPWLVGDRIGLHPLAVIFALMAGGQLFGFSGVLLALPVTAALAVGFKHAKVHYLASDFYKK